MMNRSPALLFLPPPSLHVNPLSHHTGLGSVGIGALLALAMPTMSTENQVGRSVLNSVIPGVGPTPKNSWPIQIGLGGVLVFFKKREKEHEVG